MDGRIRSRAFVRPSNCSLLFLFLAMSSEAQSKLPACSGIFCRLFDIFIDPERASRRLHTTAAWLLPLVVAGIGGIILGFANLPILIRVLEQSLPVGLTNEQAQQAISRFVAYQRIGVALSPLITVVKWSALSGVLFMSCVILDIRVTYRNLFALVAQCALLLFLEDLAIHLIVRLKGNEVRSIMDLSPRLGLDLFLSGFNKTLMAFVGYFTVFHVWYIIVLSLSISYMGECSKRRAFVAAVPVWFLPLCLIVGISWLN